MTQLEILKLQKKVAKKMLAAIAMLLVATTMLVGVSYAWVSISSAPEASKISTTVGANGYLEIALRSGRNEITGYVANDITSGRGDSSSVAGKSVTESNLTWGNIVDLNDGYGLEYVTLLPSRLNLTESYAVNIESYLGVPEFGNDGRINALNNTDRIFYNGESFTKGMNLGVCIHGDSSGTGKVGARTVRRYYNRGDFVYMMSTQLAEERGKVYNNLVSMLETDRADDLIKLFDYLASGTSVTGAEAKEAVTRLLDSLSDINEQTQSLLRYVLIAKAASDTAKFPPNDDEKMEQLSELYSNFGTWSINTIKSTATSMGYTDIVGFCNKVGTISTRLNAARTQLTNVSVVQAMRNIISVGADTFVYQDGTMLHATNANNVARALQLRNLLNDKYGDVKLANGILYYFANILGDFNVQLQNDDGYDIGLYVNGTGTSATNGKGYNCNPETNKGYVYSLTSTIINYIREEEVNYGQIYATVTEYDTVSAYGYSIDFALRSNESGNLILQQSAADRLTGESSSGGSSGDGGTLGGGSTMEFKFASDMSAGQVSSLMQSVYVVFVNQYNRILAVASAGGVTVKNTTATADLILYNYSNANGIVQTISRKSLSDQVITQITADEPLYITAIVYMSGDATTSADVSATQMYSLTGKINLQFSHSKELNAMEANFSE